MASKRTTDALLTGALPPVVAAYARLVDETTAWRSEGDEHLSALVEDGTPFITAFWHGRLLMVFRLLPSLRRPGAAMVSAHRDGEAIARTLHRLGAETVRGSAADPRKPGKAKGGAGALKAMVSLARAGKHTAITPDGPRGPRHRAQPGIAQLARLTGQPVLPLAWATQAGRQLRTWDGFFLPYPFGRGVFVYGEPIHVGRTAADVEAGRAAIEEALNVVTERADTLMGRTPTSASEAAQ